MESDIEAPGASGLTINDHVSERGPEDTGQGELSSGKKRTVFPYHIMSELSDIEAPGASGLTINNHVSERGPEDTGQGELSSGKKRTVFPYHITSELSDIEAPGTSGLTINDHVSERGPEDTGQGELSSGKKRTVFPYHITSELRSLYKGGMTGVGIQYSSLIDAACERTGLTRAQVKSWIKRTKYHQRRVLKREEERDQSETYQIPSKEEKHSGYNLPVDENNHIVMYKEMTEPALEHPRVVLLEDDSRHRDAIPALKRHLMSNETEGLVEIVTPPNNKRPRLTLLQHEELNSLSRNDVPVATTTSDHTDVYTSLPPRNIPISNVHTFHQQTHPSYPPALVISNGTTKRVTPTKESPSQEASRVFRKIERNFKRLDELGYQGFAFSIQGEETQLVYSGPIGHCFTPPLVSYLRAVIVAANPPPLISHSNSTLLNTSASHTHLPSSTPPPSRQLYMYESHPTRVQQRTAIYELSEIDSFDENGGRVGDEYDSLRMDGLVGSNGKHVHVVVTSDPNYLDLDGDTSD